MESGLEKWISNKVSQILDKRLNTEFNRIKSDVDKQISSFKDSIRAEVAADIDDINDKLSSLRTEGPSSHSHSDLSRNIIIRNLPETSSERIENMVNALFRDGLKLNDITVESAERKGSQEGSDRPGVVVVTLKSKEDKKTVMYVKRRLKDRRQYSKVYIDQDKPRAERLMESNFRAILSAVRQGGANLTLRGSRVVRTESDRDTGSGRGHERERSPAPRDSNRRSDSSEPRDKPPRGNRSEEPRGRGDRRPNNGSFRNFRR